MKNILYLSICLALTTSCADFESPFDVRKLPEVTLVDIHPSNLIEFDNVQYNFYSYEGDVERTIEPLLEEMDGEEARVFKTKYFKAISLLNRGFTAEAIAVFQDILEIKDTRDFIVNDLNKPLYELLAISYMRMGEQQNCVANHTSSSCIFPIAPQGQHHLPEGSKKAIQLYSHILEKYPDDLQSKWLLNLAYMTLGQYPDKVPQQHLVKEKKVDGEKLLKPFVDIAGGLGLDVMDNCGGSSMEDFNGDGYLDIMASSWGDDDQLKYLVNQGDGKFKDQTEAAGLNGIYGGLNITHADYNNDGYRDVLILRGAWLHQAGEKTNSLLRNNGDGTFTEVTKESGLISAMPTQTAVWSDFNRDGWLDLFIGNESSQHAMYPCELYLNKGDGTFIETAKRCGLDFSAWVKGATVGDINNDGWPDLFLSVLGGANKLFLNQGIVEGNLIFSDISEQAGIEMPFFSFPALFLDYNNDGWEDIFVSTYDLSDFNELTHIVASELMGLPVDADVSKLYRNNGDGTFTDVAVEVGLNKTLFAMGLNFGDIDNDGWLDIYAGTGAPDFRTITPNKMFINNSGRKFEDVTTLGGFGHIQKGHAISFGDLDNDGDQDIYAVMGGAYTGDIFQNVLFENPGNENNYLTLELQGSTCNRDAIGARIMIITEDKNGEQRVIYNTVGTGGSFGASSIRQEIGLEQARRILSLTIVWPDGANSKQVFTNVPINAHVNIVQSDTTFRLIELEKIKFVAQSHGHQGHLH